MNENVVIVGGGISGLAAAIYLARGGRSVTVFEKRRYLGGRAITHLRHGFRFNLGPRLVVRKGAGRSVYHELGIPLRGGRARLSGTALLGDRRYRLPASVLSLLFTSLLGGGGRLALASLFRRIRKIDLAALQRVTVGQWLDQHVNDDRTRLLMEALVRLATYSSDLGQSAGSALRQLDGLLRGVVYVDEGWQKLVDALHSNAVSAGVNFVTSSRVIRVDCEDSVQAIELGGLEDEEEPVPAGPEPVRARAGARVPAQTVLLTVDPATALKMVGDKEFARTWGDLRPVTASCLDVALSRLPVPGIPFAVGLDRPFYAGAHSVHAQLTPRGGAMLHALKYQSGPAYPYDDNYDQDRIVLSEADRNDEQELQSLLDALQPGWREVVLHQRFLPSLPVSNALVTPATPRPAVRTPVRGLYLAGDWVEADGLLADAALGSAREAAMSILAAK